MKLYKYMPADFGLEAIRTRKIKVTTILDANDPNEWMPVCPDPKNGVEDYHKNPRYRAQFRYWWATHQGFISLSAKWDNPVLWGHYADKCRGVALMFEPMEVNDRKVKEVKYCDDRYVLDEREIYSEDQDKINRLVARKARVWEYEKEYRVLADLRLCETKRIGNDTLYFHPLDNPVIKLTGILMGPESTVTCYDVHNAFKGSPPLGFTGIQLAFDSPTYGIVKSDHKVWNGKDWITQEVVNEVSINGGVA